MCYNSIHACVEECNTSPTCELKCTVATKSLGSILLDLGVDYKRLGGD